MELIANEDAINLDLHSHYLWPTLQTNHFVNSEI